MTGAHYHFVSRWTSSSAYIVAALVMMVFVSQFSKKISRPAVKNICLPPNPRPNLAKLNLIQNSIDCQKTCYWVLISDGEHVLLWNFVISSGFPHGHGSLASSGDHFYGSCDLKVPVA